MWDLATADQVRRSMDRLPESERAAIELAYFGGYTYREVATRLGEPENRQGRIRSGLKRLRGELVSVGISLRRLRGDTTRDQSLLGASPSTPWTTRRRESRQCLAVDPRARAGSRCTGRSPR